MHQSFFFFNYWRASCVVLSFIACMKTGVVLCRVSGAALTAGVRRVAWE